MTESAKKARERREFYKAHGMCIYCWQEYAEPGHVHCNSCMDKRRRMRIASDPDGTKHKAQMRELRTYRKEHGLCIDCGKPSEGFARCKRCRARRMDSYRKQAIIARMDKEAERLREGEKHGNDHYSA